MGHTVIIAEAGVNHNGSIENAKKLVREAKKAGADIVKFQTAKLNSLVSKHAEMAEYQKRNTGEVTSQREMLKKLLLTYDEFKELAQYCKEVGITFLSTPFDIESIVFLKILGCSVWKVPSGEITNYPYLVEIAKTKLPIILSTGMCTMDEIDSALQLLRENGAGEIKLLHCTTEYPTPFVDVNLKAMLTLKKKFGVEVGYSDHTMGIEIAVAAVAMGATVIEKHFTLDRNMEGPDHKASLEPDELCNLVESIRNVEIALGDGVKQPTETEIENIKVARKSIIARVPILKGEIFTTDNITTKRPGTGITPMRWNEVIGKQAKRDFLEDELIEL